MSNSVEVTTTPCALAGTQSLSFATPAALCCKAQLPRQTAASRSPRLPPLPLCGMSALRRCRAMAVGLARPPTTLSMARLAATSSAVRGPADSGASEGPSLRIGDVAVAVLPPARPELVPAGYARMDGADSQSRLRHLRWIMQKDLLGQDVFLIGAPGSLRRRLALQYCELTEREVEYIALSKDTTEADIKQRREIVGGTAHYVDQCAVRAALEGRVLILEGIEKAERNLLPILNNLMENREMHLEDGRFLVAPSRYDALLQTHTADQLTEMRLARVSDRFRIIALGLPVPRFRGNPLDPPLRSRFQARDIRAEGYGALKAAIADAAPLLEASRPDLTAQLVSYASTIEVMNSDPEILDKLRSETHIPSVPLEGVEQVAKILESAPKASVARLLQAVHPFDHALSAASRGVVQDVLARFSVADQATDAYHIQGVNETQSVSPAAGPGKGSVRGVWPGRPCIGASQPCSRARVPTWAVLPLSVCARKPDLPAAPR